MLLTERDELLYLDEGHGLPPVEPRQLGKQCSKRVPLEKRGGPWKRSREDHTSAQMRPLRAVRLVKGEL